MKRTVTDLFDTVIELALFLIVFFGVLHFSIMVALTLINSK